MAVIIVLGTVAGVDAATQRAHCRQFVTYAQNSGAVTIVPNAAVSIYNTGTTTPVTQTMYTTATGSTTVSNPTRSDSTGLVEFWMPYAQTVDLAINASGFAAQTVTCEAGSATGSGIVNLNVSTSVANPGDIKINSSAPFITIEDNAGTPASHSVPVLDGAQTWTGTQTSMPLASPTLSGTVAGTPTWASGQTFPNATVTGTLTLTGATVAGQPTWSSAQTVPGLTITTSGLTVTAGGAQIAGNLGLAGSAPTTNRVISIVGSATTGTTQRAMYANPTFDNTASSEASGIFISTATQAAAWTLPVAHGIRIDSPALGAGSAITTNYGILINAMTTGTDANYGLYINAPSGATTNIGLYNAGTSQFGDFIGVGVAPKTNASAALEVASTTGAILIPRMTTTQRDALTAVNGMIIYNTTVDKFQGYEAGAWNNFSVL